MLSPNTVNLLCMFVKLNNFVSVYLGRLRRIRARGQDGVSWKEARTRRSGGSRALTPAGSLGQCEQPEEEK